MLTSSNSTFYFLWAANLDRSRKKTAAIVFSFFKLRFRLFLHASSSSSSSSSCSSSSSKTFKFPCRNQLKAPFLAEAILKKERSFQLYLEQSADRARKNVRLITGFKPITGNVLSQSYKPPHWSWLIDNDCTLETMNMWYVRITDSFACQRTSLNLDYVFV